MELTGVLTDVTFWDQIRDLAKSEADSPPPSDPKVRQKQIRLGAGDQSRLVAAYVGGETLEQLAQRFGIHRTTVMAVLERHGTPRRYRMLAADTLTIAAELFASGMSLAEVGAQFELDASTVQRAFKRARIPRRDTHGR